MTVRDRVASLVAAWRMARVRFLAAELAPRNPGSPVEVFLRDRAEASAPRLREATEALVGIVREHGLDAVPLRELVRCAVPGTGLRAAAAADRCLVTLDELLVRLAPKRRQRERGQSLDLQAVAAVDAFENPDEPARRPEWTVKDVAEVVGVKPAAINGKQRDGTLRCPMFMARWKVHKARHERQRADRRRR